MFILRLQMHKQEWKPNMWMLFLLVIEAAPLLVWVLMFDLRGEQKVDGDGAVSGHGDVIKRKHVPRYRPFVRGIHRSPVHRSPSQRPVTRIFDFFFDMCLNKRLSKQSRRRWFEAPSRLLWCHFNVINYNTSSCSKTKRWWVNQL